jgi:uncharacterized protein YkwD
LLLSGKITGMDFDTFNLGVYQFLVSAASAVAIFLPIHQATAISQPLNNPSFESAVNEKSPSYQLTSSNYNIESAIVSKETIGSVGEIILAKSAQPDLVSLPSTKPEDSQVSSETGVILPSPSPSGSPLELAVLPKSLPRNLVKTTDKTDATNTATVLAATAKPKPSLTPEPDNITETASDQPTGNPFDLPIRTLKSSLNPEVLFNLINKHRADIGMPAFEKDGRLCQLAQYRAPMLQREIFGGGVMHSGLRALKLPYWITENIAGYNTEQVIFNFWMSDYIHKKAIESDNKYSCGACSGNTCAQEFSSFVPK